MIFLFGRKSPFGNFEVITMRLAVNGRYRSESATGMLSAERKQVLHKFIVQVPHNGNWLLMKRCPDQKKAATKYNTEPRPTPLENDHIQQHACIPMHCRFYITTLLLQSKLTLCISFPFPTKSAICFCSQCQTDITVSFYTRPQFKLSRFRFEILPLSSSTLLLSPVIDSNRSSDHREEVTAALISHLSS